MMSLLRITQEDNMIYRAITRFIADICYWSLHIVFYTILSAEFLNDSFLFSMHWSEESFWFIQKYVSHARLSLLAIGRSILSPISFQSVPWCRLRLLSQWVSLARGEYDRAYYQLHQIFRYSSLDLTAAKYFSHGQVWFHDDILLRFRLIFRDEIRWYFNCTAARSQY